MLFVTALFGGLMLLSVREPAPHGRSLADWLYRRSRNIAPAGAGTASLLPAMRHSGCAQHHHGDDRRLADQD